jgi:hypothetical protein
MPQGLSEAVNRIQSELLADHGKSMADSFGIKHAQLKKEHLNIERPMRGAVLHQLICRQPN